MKIKTLLLCIAGVAVSLSSCKLDNDDEDNYTSVAYPVCNLVIPQNGGNAFASRDVYTLVYYTESGTVTVSSQAFSTGSGSPMPFQTSAMPYKLYEYGAYPEYYQVTKFSGGISGTGVNVSNLEGYTSQWVNILPPSIANSVTGYPYNAIPALVMSYTADNNYNVRTFLPDAVFTGTTQINMVGAPMPPFESNQTIYRVVFSQDMQKADVIFYNSKFAEQMPAITFVVRNLDVLYNRQGYTITIPEGTEYIVPEMQEGGKLEPYQPYRFSQFSLTPVTSDLTGIMINFNIQRIQGGNVAGEFRCSFNGTYTTSDPSSSKD